MERILELGSLQLTLFLLIIIGLIMRKTGSLDKAGVRSLSNLVLNLVIPASIVKSFLIPLDQDLLLSCGFLALIGLGVQILSLLINNFAYNRYPEQEKKILQYATLVSNGGFLGNPVAEGVYGNLGLLYASTYMIPVRMTVWSIGSSYFVPTDPDRKKMLKNVLTHPCIVAVYLGLFLMLTQIQLPSVVVSTLHHLSNCNSALTMLIIGTILDSFVNLIELVKAD